MNTNKYLKVFEDFIDEQNECLEIYQHLQIIDELPECVIIHGNLSIEQMEDLLEDSPFYVSDIYEDGDESVGISINTFAECTLKLKEY